MVAEFPYFNMTLTSWIEVWFITIFPNIRFSHVSTLYRSLDVHFYVIKFSVNAR
jgi:hypothetical protein